MWAFPRGQSVLEAWFSVVFPRENTGFLGWLWDWFVVRLDTAHQTPEVNITRLHDRLFLSPPP